MTPVNFLIFVISSSCFRRRSLDFQVQFTIFFFHVVTVWYQTLVNNILSWCFSFITLRLIFLRAHSSVDDVHRTIPTATWTVCLIQIDLNLELLVPVDVGLSRMGDGVLGYIIFIEREAKLEVELGDSAKEMVGQELKEDRFVYCYPRIIVCCWICLSVHFYDDALRIVPAHPDA